MLRNYLIIAFRNFSRQKLFSLLNIFGLAFGLASAILIFLYVSDELRYDVMHPDYKNTYRVGITFTNGDGQSYDNTEAPGFFVRYLKDNRSDILKSSRIAYIGYPTSLNYKEKDKIILTEEIKWAEPNFTDVLDFHLLRGNRQRMFENPNSMVISEKGAERLFGKDDPVGKIISVKHRWATNDREVDVMVTGVYKDYPSNSHFKPKFILNLNAFRTIYGNDFDYYMEGTSFDRQRFLGFFQSYITVKPGTNIVSIRATLDRLADQLVHSDSAFVASGGKVSTFLTNMQDLHFDKKNLWEDTNVRGDKTYLSIFSIIAVLIMVIACINYMNLATARSVKRAREVGLRKSFGSNRSWIAQQFFLESFLMILGALTLALVMDIISLNAFNQLSHKSFTIASLLNPVMIAVTGGIILFMGFISGLYPAFYLSGFQPVEVLKGQIAKGKTAELFRKGLVTVQYTVALVLIICTLVVIRQMEQLKTSKLNERGSQILSIRFGGIAPQERFLEFKRSVLEDPQIEYVTMGNHLPRLNYFGWIGTQVSFPDLENKKLDWNQLNVDFDFVKTFKLQIIAGRDFQTGNLNDSNTMIINEAGVRALKQPLSKVVGTTINQIRFDTTLTYRIIGVVKDFPFRSMHQPIEPLLLNPHPHFIDKIVYVKLPAGKYSEKIASIGKKWKAVFPGVGFDHWFLNDEFNRMYDTESQVSALAKVFAVLSILITILGVFGLASYTAEQRTKEIGIRKVLGASERQVVSLFLNLFLKIIAVACLVAIPLAWLAANKWLQNFVYRTKIDPMVFAVSLLVLLAITLMTVAYEIFKSVRTSPVKSLRTE